MKTSVMIYTKKLEKYYNGKSKFKGQKSKVKGKSSGEKEKAKGYESLVVSFQYLGRMSKVTGWVRFNCTGRP